jgi:hypothetical protein
MLMIAGCGGGGNGVIDMTPPEALLRTEHFSAVAAADMDGDGFTDIVTASDVTEDRRRLFSRLSIYRQDDTQPGRFLPPSYYDYGSLPADPDWFVITDVNMDDQPDVLATSWNESGFRAFLNDPANPGALLPSTHYPLSEENSSFGKPIAVADIDADGLPDVARVTDETLYWFRNDGSNPGRFAAAGQIGPGREDVAAGDINSDGLADLATIRDTGLASKEVTIYRNSPFMPSTFQWPSHVRLPIFVNEIGLADLDGNGLVDIAVMGSDVGDDYDPRDDGRFFAMTQDSPGQFTLSNVARTLSMGIGDRFVIGDLDGDIFADVVANVRSAILIIEFNRSGNPMILYRLIVPTEDLVGSTGGGAPFIADLNNDGMSDIAVLRGALFVFYQRPSLPGAMDFDDPVMISTPL